MIREYSEKDVMFVTDMPLVKEESSGKPYSEYSSGEIKNNLVRFSMLANILNIIPEAKYLSEDEAKKKVVADNKVGDVTSSGYFLNDSNVCYTYLFTERYVKGDFDFIHSLVNKKNIPEGETYIQITWLKDVWVSQHLYGQIQAFIEQINKVKPKIVVLAGKWALMLFGAYIEDSTKPIATIGTTRSTAKSPKQFGALNKFRGSLLTFNSEVPLHSKVAVIAMLSPAFYYQIQEKFYIIQRDYLKVASFAVQAKNKSVDELLTDNKITNVALLLPEAITYLNELLEQLDKEPTKVSIDVETKFQAIDCIGLCWKSNESFTIPFIEMYSVVVTEDTPAFINKYGVEQRTTALAGTNVTKFRHYWTIEEECEIQFLLNKVLLHNNCLHVGQNYNYDSQYYYKTWWIRVYASYDTMIQHHVLHNTLQKDLASLASMYCDNYSYWKDEIDVKHNLTRWKYNGKDVIYTLAITEFLDKVLQQSETLLSNYEFQQHELNPCVVDMMNRGILVDTNEKENNLNIFKDLMAECITKINYICGEEVNLNSTPQVKRLFKDMLGIVPKRDRKSSSESFGADAMLTYLDMYPEYRTLLTLFLEYKSIKVFVTNFLSAKLDDDGKMRCDYNIAGTISYRFSSRKNVFGGGCNMSNVPSKGKIDLNIALQETDETISDFEFITDANNTYSGILKLPNVKKMFIPPVGYKFFDSDYSAVDLCFVAYDSDCKYLKDIIRDGKDVYSILASEYYQKDITKKDNERQIFKSIIHGKNYRGQAPTLAAKAGLSIPRVKKVLQFYDSKCPEVELWQTKRINEAKKYGYVTNVFGFKGDITDFVSPTWENKVVAWIGQSSTACLVNKALVNLVKQEQMYDDKIYVLLQTHDSLSGIFKKEDTTAPERIKKYMELQVDYPDSLVIKANVLTSEISYGDCK